MSVGVSLGTAAPGGTGVAIAALPGAAADGDFVLIAFAWAVGFATRQLLSVSDTNGNTWTVVPFGSASESGGYGFCIVGAGKGWAAGANTVTGTLSGGTPGGRVWAGVKIPAANLAASPIDQHVEASNQTTQTPSVTSGPLAQASEACFGVDVMRVAAGTAAFTWSAPFAAVNFIAGSGTTTSGVGIGEFDNSTGTAAVTASGSSTGATDTHGMGIIAVKLASSGIVLSAPLATVASAGILGAPVEVASAPLASVASVGLSPLGALVLAAPMAAVASIGFSGNLPAGAERFRTRFYRPVVEAISSKWEGWWRFQ